MSKPENDLVQQLFAAETRLHDVREQRNSALAALVDLGIDGSLREALVAFATDPAQDTGYDLLVQLIQDLAPAHDLDGTHSLEWRSVALVHDALTDLDINHRDHTE